MRTIIQGGTVVTAVDTVAADVLVDGERSSASWRRAPPWRSSSRRAADLVIDATGSW